MHHSPGIKQAHGTTAPASAGAFLRRYAGGTIVVTKKEDAVGELTVKEIQGMMPDLKVSMEPVGRLSEYENNAKVHTAEQIDQVKRSIRLYGFNDPIGVWTNAEGKSEIVEGHGRLRAALEMGFSEVPVIHLDRLTDAQRRAYTHVHNQLTMNTGWDLDKLAIDLDDLDLDLEGFGFEFDEGEEFEEEVSIEDVVEDDFDEDDVAQRVKPGELWRMGDHLLFCGDSTDPSSIDLLTEGGRAALLLTDPPYNVDYEGKTKDALKIQNDKMGDGEFRAFLRDAFISADSGMLRGASFYIFHADSEGYNFRGACRDAGWTVRQCLVWVKQSLVLGRQDYQWKHEPCLYGWKDGAAHQWNSDRSQTTVLEFDRPTVSRLHPTMKPIALFAYVMQNSTRCGDLVLDPFAGSGTTVMAAEQLGRRALAIELDPHYCDVILSRWEDYTGGTAAKVK